jgi:para-nitrobenzyl esterase
MQKQMCGLLFLAAVAVVPLTAAIKQPVRTKGGLVSGVPGTDPSVIAFKGIPFAAPPIGRLRWSAPAAPPAWQGVRKADHFSASCMQNIVDERKPWTHEFMTHGEISEDCLYLNVWTAAKSARAKRPVFVWIHGGANTEGSGAVPVYDGEGLAKKGLLVVTVNYRLGVLGFFAHPELTAESEHKASGNYALLDLVAALEWIHGNIAAFGGDPKRVTIAGQSAGASNAHALTASPLARGLFQRVIAESGSGVGGPPGGTRTLADAEKDGVRFAEAKGAHSLAELRAMPWKDLTTPGGGFRFGVVVDGYFLPAPPSEIFAQGKQNDVPTLTGCNADEGGAVPHPTITLAAFQKQAAQRYQEEAAAFLRLYPASTDEQAGVAQNESARDQARVSMYLWAVNRAKTARTDAYTYFWNHALPGPDVEKYGAFHTSEVPYALNSLSQSDRPFTAADHRIAGEVSSYWVNFAATGDPNGKGLPHWPSVREKPATTMNLGGRMEVIPVAGSEEKLRFFQVYFAKPRAPRVP